MKYYIPTTTANVGKIFSTGSISPAIFYEKQDGSNDFIKVKPNKKDTEILLYSKYPKFDINDGDNAFYPMIIEIDSNVEVDVYNEHEDITIYSYDDTIYLYKGKCLFYFNNEEGKKKAESNIDSNNTCKFQDLYEESFKIYNDDFFEWSNEYMKKEETLKTQNSKIIDRIKGFILGYSEGIKNSIDNRNFYNAILAMNEEIEKNIDNPEELKNNIKEFKNNYIKNKKNKNINELIDIKDGTLEILDIVADDEYKEFYHYIINEIIYSDYPERFPIDKFIYEKNDNDSNVPLETATKAGKLFREHILKELDKQEQDNHKGRIYLAELFASISSDNKDGKFKYITENSNDILEGFAIYCQKGIGDKDEPMTNLKEKLENENFNSHKYALGILGAKIGFTNISKIFKKFNDDFFTKEFNEDLSKKLKNNNTTRTSKPEEAIRDNNTNKKNQQEYKSNNQDSKKNGDNRNTTSGKESSSSKVKAENVTQGTLQLGE